MTTSTRAGGMTVAIISSAAFAMSGPLAKPLLDAGWTPGAAVIARVGGSALVMLIPTLLIAWQSRGRAISRNSRFLLGYGVVAVAGTQIGFFSAIRTLPVGVALLIEYLAPVIVVLWLWLRRGMRPTRLTVVGGILAMIGLVLVLDLSGTSGLDPVGVAWALWAALCLTGYFLLSAHTAEDLSPVLVVGTGMVVGALVLLAAAAIGLLPLAVSTTVTSLGGTSVPWWVPAAGLVLLSTVFAYLTGILAVQQLGSRLASFVALVEVLFAVGAAWLLLAQVPTAMQALGGTMIIGGVVLVRLGERPAGLESLPAPTDETRTVDTRC